MKCCKTILQAFPAETWILEICVAGDINLHSKSYPPPPPQAGDIRVRNVSMLSDKIQVHEQDSDYHTTEKLIVDP